MEVEHGLNKGESGYHYVLDIRVFNLEAPTPRH